MERIWISCEYFTDYCYVKSRFDVKKKKNQQQREKSGFLEIHEQSVETKIGRTLYK